MIQVLIQPIAAMIGTASQELVSTNAQLCEKVLLEGWEVGELARKVVETEGARAEMGLAKRRSDARKCEDTLKVVILSHTDTNIWMWPENI